MTSPVLFGFWRLCFQSSGTNLGFSYLLHNSLYPCHCARRRLSSRRAKRTRHHVPRPLWSPVRPMAEAGSAPSEPRAPAAASRSTSRAERGLGWDRGRKRKYGLVLPALLEGRRVCLYLFVGSRQAPLSSVLLATGASCCVSPGLGHGRGHSVERWAGPPSVPLFRTTALKVF